MGDLNLTLDEVDTLYGSLASLFIIFEERRERLKPLMKKMEDYLEEQVKQNRTETRELDTKWIERFEDDTAT